MDFYRIIERKNNIKTNKPYQYILHFANFINGVESFIGEELQNFALDFDSIFPSPELANLDRK